MRILVVCQYYSPDITAAAFRIRETVDLLKKGGHDLRVITAEPHKSEVAVDEAADEAEGVYRVPVSAIARGVRGYLSHYLLFVLRSLWVGVKQRFGSWRPDIIWTSSPPLFIGITGRTLARLYGCPMVFDIRDIWPQSAVAADQISEDGRAYKLGRILERRLYGGADHITCVSQPMADYIAAETNTPVTVIYNGVLDGPANQRRAPPAIEKRILYAGNLGRVQGLEVLINAFADSIQDGGLPGWRFDFIGGGAFDKDLRNLVTARGIGGWVSFHPPVSKDEIFGELARSAALVINLKADKVFELTIPSKVFDYMSVGRPILYGISGEGAAILGSTGANIAFSASDGPSFAEAMRNLDANYAHLQAAAAKNPLAVRGRYSRERNVEVLVQVFEQLVGKRYENSYNRGKWFRRYQSNRESA